MSGFMYNSPSISDLFCFLTTVRYPLCIGLSVFSCGVHLFPSVAL